MASLSNTELSKFRNGQYRWDIFRYKLVNKEPFVLEKKTAAKLGITEAVLVPVCHDFIDQVQTCVTLESFEKLSYSKFYIEGTDIQVGLTNLQKTAEFGSSSGSGGGQQQTQKVEALTAVMCAVKQGGTSYCGDVFLGTTSLNKSWYTSLTDTVETLTSSKQVSSFPDFHYQDEFVEGVKKNYLRLRKGTSFSTKQIDKWNPADIWATSGSCNTGSLDNADSLDELSSLCFSDRVRGISLKKGGTKVKCVLAEDTGQWKVDNLEILPREEGHKSLRIRFNFEGGPNKILTIRPNGTAFRAEVMTEGSNHRNGGCGQEQLNRCLKEVWPKLENFRFEILDKLRKEGKEHTEENILRAVEDVLHRFERLFGILPTGQQKAFIGTVVRICVCQAEGHCSYIKVS